MQFGIHFPPFGPFSDVQTLAELAAEAEQAGWDGFFLWDDINFDPAFPMSDPWIALAAIALHTKRMRLGALVTPLPRRRPWKVARETVTLDHLSRGRMVFGVGLGVGESEWADLGEQPDIKVRAAMLDEGLQVLTGLWCGEPFHFAGTHYQVKAAQFLPRAVQSPRIPIWVAGSWPNKAPFRRAARWDGVYPLGANLSILEMLAPQDIASLLSYMAPYREAGAPLDVIHWGFSAGEDAQQDQALVASYADVGVTWWLESVMPQRWGGNWSEWPLEQMYRRVRQGPPKGQDK